MITTTFTIFKKKIAQKSLKKNKSIKFFAIIAKDNNIGDDYANTNNTSQR